MALYLNIFDLHTFLNQEWLKAKKINSELAELTQLSLIV